MSFLCQRSTSLFKTFFTIWRWSDDVTRMIEWFYKPGLDKYSVWSHRSTFLDVWLTKSFHSDAGFHWLVFHPNIKKQMFVILFEINPLSVESLLKFFREEPFWLIQVQLYDKWKFVLNRLAMYFGSKNNIFCASKKSKNDIFSEQIGSVFWVQKWNMLRGEQGLKRESLVKLLICFVKNNALAVLPEK